MTKNMWFESSDYQKLTADQKQKLRNLTVARCTRPYNTNSATNSIMIQVTLLVQLLTFLLEVYILPEVLLWLWLRLIL